MLEATNLFFNRAADHLELPDNLRIVLQTPRRVVRVEIVTESDDGRKNGESYPCPWKWLILRRSRSWFGRGLGFAWHRRL